MTRARLLSPLKINCFSKVTRNRNPFGDSLLSSYITASATATATAAVPAAAATAAAADVDADPEADPDADPDADPKIQKLSEIALYASY